MQSSEESLQFRASLDGSSEEYRKVLAEYYHLAHLPELSQKQAERMQHIFTMANADEVMGLLLNEIDELTFQELGFYDEVNQSYFQDQASRVQEYVLSAVESKRLTPSVVVGHKRAIESDAISDDYPRVEMVDHPSYSDRQALHRQFLLDGYSFSLVSQDNSYPSRNHGAVSRCLTWPRGRALYLFIQQESISIFAVLALILWMLILL